MAGETTLGTAQIPIRATLDELDKDLEGARSKVEGALDAIQAAGKAALALGAIGLGAVATSLFAGIKGAMEEEMVFTNLEATLKSVSATADRQAAAYQAAQGKIVTSSAMTSSALSELHDKYRLQEIAIANQRSIVDSLTAKYGTANTATESASIKLRQMQSVLSDLGAQVQAGGKIIRTSLADSLSLVPPVARMTMDEMVALGDRLSRTTLFTHEQINTVDAMLLTFTNIGKDVFPAATVAVANMGAKFGSLDSAAIQVGKALQDPINGVTALRRVGVMLTDQQEKQIKEFMKQGKTAEAQKLILAELTTEFGGLAEAMGNTATGKMTILKHAFDEVLETVGAYFLPVISEIADKALPMLDSALKAIGPIAEDIGNSVGNFVTNLLAGSDPLTSFKVLLGQLFPSELSAAIKGVIDGILQFIASIRPTIDQVMAWLSQNVQLKDVLIAVGIAIASVVIPAILGVVASVAPIIIAFAALVAIVALVRQAWDTNWNGIRTTLTTFWTGTAQPMLAQLWTWLQVNIPTAIQMLSGFWTGTLVPAMQTAWAFIQTGVIPMLGNLWNWLQINIPVAIQTLSAFWIGTLLPAIQTAWTFIQTSVLPMLATLWAWLSVNVPVAIQTLSNLWTGTLLPALTAVWNYLSANLFPALMSIYDAISTNLPLAIQVLTNFWNSVLLPVLQLIWSYIQTVLVPMFTGLAQILTTVVGMAIQVLTDYWSTVLYPIIMMIWNFITQSLNPLFLALADLLVTVVGKAVQILTALWVEKFQPAVKSIWDYIDKNVIPIFKTVAEVVRVTLGGAFQWVSDNVLKPFASVLGWISGLIQDTIDSINRLKGALGSVKVPPVLAPGSPSPFEVALRGIRDEMGALAGMAMPTLTASMERASSAELAPRGGEQGASRSGPSIVNIYGLSLNGVQDRAGLLEQLQGYA